MANIIYDEPSGVLTGVLKEDFIVTAKRVGRPFIDVFYEDNYTDGQEYPLTYVPQAFSVSPLKEGDSVIAVFNQANFRYPVLYKLGSEFPEGMLDDWEVPTGSDGVEPPATEETVSVTRLGENAYVLVTASYLALRFGDTGLVLDSSNISALSSVFQTNAATTKLNKTIISGGSEPAARKGHTIKATIPAGTVVVAVVGQATGTMNTTPITLQGEITEGEATLLLK